MNYQEFKSKVREFPVFSSSQLSAFGEDLQILRNQLSFWRGKGLLLKLRRGLYVLNKDDRKVDPSRLFLAGQMLSPSYISTHYALAYYGLIPERVTDITSVTTKKTTLFDNEFGRFVYQHLKVACFNGFLEKKDNNGFAFFIAEPEKALIDFFYLNLAQIADDDILIFQQSYRLRKDKNLKAQKMRYYAQSYNSKKLLRIVQNFVRYLGKK